MKQSVTTQINELTSTFQPEAMKPVTSADMDMKIADDLLTLCQNHGTLSAHELLPDPSKCFITNPACLESAEVNIPVKVNIQAIDHIGNPCRLHQNFMPSMDYQLVSEVQGQQKEDSCRGSESQYTVEFTPIEKGQNHLYVTINGHPIEGSPFTVHVKSFVTNVGNRLSTISNATLPWGIAVNKKREIFVSESRKHCISIFSTDGKKTSIFWYLGIKR